MSNNSTNITKNENHLSNNVFQFPDVSAKPLISSVRGLGTALPPMRLKQMETYQMVELGFYKQITPASMRLLRKLASHPSIEARHFAVDNPAELVHETLDERVQRFTKWSSRLAVEAIRKALEDSGFRQSDIKALVINTCTGYICPGITSYVLEQMNLPSTTFCYDLVGSGCGGAVPNLQFADKLARQTDDGIVVSVSVEISTAAIRMGDDPSLLVSNTIFADGAAAVVIAKESVQPTIHPQGTEQSAAKPTFSLRASKTLILPAKRESIRFVHKDGQLYNQLAVDLPDTIGDTAALIIDEFLGEQQLSRSDIDHWAIHPGGAKVVNRVQQSLALSDETLQPTRDILRECGNMSSPTVLFILEKILATRSVQSGQKIILLAFGAGLSAHAYLLEVN